MRSPPGCIFSLQIYYTYFDGILYWNVQSKYSQAHLILFVLVQYKVYFTRNSDQTLQIFWRMDYKYNWYDVHSESSRAKSERNAGLT
jgi:hypothetical protein